MEVVNHMSLLSIISKGKTYGCMNKDNSVSAVSRWSISPKVIKGRKEFARRIIEYAQYWGVSGNQRKQLADISKLTFFGKSIHYPHGFRSIAMYSGSKLTLIDAYRIVSCVRESQKEKL